MSPVGSWVVGHGPGHTRFIETPDTTAEPGPDERASETNTPDSTPVGIPVDAESGPVALPPWLAIALVTGTSGAVLILEILAGRLLAPYVGVNLETYTAIIGTILAGIACGAWMGGVLADRTDPRRLIPLFLVLGGALAISSIPVVRVIGGETGPSTVGMPSMLLALWGFGPAAAVLSAVPPAVVKLQLQDLGQTGSTVGRLSAWSTGGAIVGTFLAGYVLVVFAAVTTLIVTVGMALMAAGLVFGATHRHVPPRSLLASGGLAGVALIGLVVSEHPCDVQSSYYCIQVEVDADDPDGRTLVLDDLRHSYVDLGDPGHLEFWYIRRITEAIEVDAPSGPIDVVTVGAGAMTVPRWIRTTRPGSEVTVLEIDGDLIDLIDAELPVEPGRTVADLQGLEAVVGDGRATLRTLPDDSADVIVGDAFGSRAVPWHLATREFMADVARVLRPGGVYVANIIDGTPEKFLRAETATMRAELPHVSVMRGPNLIEGFPGNSVVVASAEPFDGEAWDRLRTAAGDDGMLISGDAVEEYLDGALILTDDYAPVDQLILGVG